MADVTVEILKEIRDEIRSARADLTEELAATRSELTGRLDRLERRQVETEVRLATELTAVVGAVHEVRDALREDRKLRETVSDHERRICQLERAPAR